LKGKQMKYAVVEGVRREAEPSLSGKCPRCGNAVIAKCGEIRVQHWAHRGTRTCDPWKEPETEWHRAWKNQFPEDRQEIIQWAKDGEKHIADVKTKGGVVLEFQYSHIQRQERESREMFYQKIVWIVNGVRRKRDKAQFFACVDEAAVIKQEPLIVSVRWKEGALLRDWGESRAPVFFDFPDTPFLWRLNPCTPNGMTYLLRVPKKMFLDAHLKGFTFDQEKTVSAEVERAAAIQAIQQAPRPLIGFQRYPAQRIRRYARF
jgi:hypothetical protein